MTVLVEGISVIIRRDRLPPSLADLSSRTDIWDTRTLCADDELVAVAFMAPADVKGCVDRLQSHGLIHTGDGAAKDLVVVDQLRGPTTPCEWIDVYRVEIEGNSVMACRLRGSAVNTVAAPLGWDYDNSLSKSFGFVPKGAEDKSLRFLRH